MIVFKKHIDTTTDGAITLFQLPTEYEAGSITVLEMKADKSVVVVDFTELGSGFIETTSPPAGTSSLLIMYSYNDTSIELAANTLEGLKPWESKKLIQIMEAIVEINSTIEKILSGFKNKVSKEEVASIVGPLYEKVRALETNI
ncbi:hypothetical protein KAZ66_00540 [Candidatus Woesebacteria bacterium]|nr:hypothetical protein [Candidatus Woesebacteria bacterium]